MCSQKLITASDPQQMMEEVVSLHQSGQLEAAEKGYQKLLTIFPNNVGLLNNLGTVNLQKGELEEAVRILHQSLSISPHQPNALNNISSALRQLGRLEEAVENCQKAIALNPKFVNAHYNLGNIFGEMARFHEALESYNHVIALQPNYADAYLNRGNMLRDLKRFDEAMESYNHAIDMRPNYADAYFNRGNLFKDLEEFERAVENYDRAIALNPDHAGMHFNRGNSLMVLNRIQDANLNYERAFALNPDIDCLLGNLLCAKMKLSLWDDFEKLTEDVVKRTKEGKMAATPFTILSLVDDPAIHRKSTEKYTKAKHPANELLPNMMDGTKHDKIRIGYFSADFKDHPVAFLTAELYERHDRERFEIHAFSLIQDTHDGMNERIKKAVDHFHHVHEMGDEDIVALSRSLEIDIAVDLGGYTQGSRTQIFAMRLAPIQVNYLGYPGTMGAGYFDYLIADRTVIPEDKECHYVEDIIYLPDSYMVNGAGHQVSQRMFTRQECGLPQEGFVFCCFNQNYKITPDVFASWMRILDQVQGSVLWLTRPHDEAMNNLRNEAQKNGIDANRLIFAPKTEHVEDHLNRIQLADLFLDTLPYNAHATTSDALKMGLPVLTRMGQSFASRVAASLLQAVGLPELITVTTEQYETIAVTLATHPEDIKRVKDTLSANLPISKLYDTQLFTHNIESVYSTIYRKR